MQSATVIPPVCLYPSLACLGHMRLWWVLLVQYCMRCSSRSLVFEEPELLDWRYETASNEWGKNTRSTDILLALFCIISKAHWKWVYIVRMWTRTLTAVTNMRHNVCNLCFFCFLLARFCDGIWYCYVRTTKYAQIASALPRCKGKPQFV